MATINNALPEQTGTPMDKVPEDSGAIADSRESRINEAFVKVADTLLDSYDIVDLLSTLVDQCTDLLGVQAGGLLISDGSGSLELIASTNEQAEFVEIMQLAAGAGPCVDCYLSGQPLSVPDIRATTQWPAFRDAALNSGFLSVHATPMRFRKKVIGTMNLLGTEVSTMAPRDVALAQALADVAIIGIMQERSIRDPQMVAEQLHLALDTRILVEQAKGVLAVTIGANMNDAFATLRHYARDNSLTLREVAFAVTARTLEITTIAPQQKGTK